MCVRVRERGFSVVEGDGDGDDYNKPGSCWVLCINKMMRPARKKKK